MANEIQTTENGSRAIMMDGNDFMLGLTELKRRADMVSQIKAQIMKSGKHYGVIPGCGDKPTLLKNGAELLCMAFKMAPDAKVSIADLGNGHREYTVTTTLASNVTGLLIATGLGSCSTMESKYRYRNVADFELTGLPIPEDSKERKAEYRKQGFGMKKVNGVWEWVRFKDGAKQENPDIADTYNTVLKMASKRSLVDAVLKATGGSCEFTQDIEDMAPQAEYADYSVTDNEQVQNEKPAQQARKNSPQQTNDEDFEGFKRSIVPLAQKDSIKFCEMMKKYGCKNIEQIPKASRDNFYKDLKAAINAPTPKSGPTAKEQSNEESRDF